MKENTVLLKIEEYNQLRDFKRGIEELGETIIIENFSGYCNQTCYTTEEIVKELNTKNKKLLDENHQLRLELYEKQKEIETKLEYVKNMTVGEFKKWRNGKRK